MRKQCIVFFYCIIQEVLPFLVSPDPEFLGPIDKGRVDDGDVNEISGLVASRVHAGIVYAHNDKGDGPKIYAINGQTAHVVATISLQGAHNYDWEDIAAGSCDPSSTSSGHCLFIGDTGDHSGDGAHNIIYRVREPATLHDMTIPVDAVLHFAWPDPSTDAETLLLDHRNGDIILISKADNGRGIIGKIPLSAWMMNGVYNIQNPTPINLHTHHRDPRGGDISSDGQVLVKTDKNIFYWKLTDTNSDYLDILQQTPGQVLYVPEHQGESVCWDVQGRGYYTISEGKHEHLHYYGLRA